MGWVTDICIATGWQASPRDILDTEEAYPFLWDDIMIELWQRKLAKDQLGSDE